MHPDQQVALEIQIHQRNARHFRLLADHKLQRLRPTVENMVQRLHIAADRILHRAHITDNIICRNHLRRNKAINIQRIQNFIKGNTVDFAITFGTFFALA